MDLTTIAMSREEARKAFLEYRHAIQERHSEEDAQIMRGYRALSRGRQLLRLSTTIAAAGLNEVGQPRLAIARADHTHVWAAMTHDRVAYCPAQDSRHRHSLADRRCIVDLPLPGARWVPSLRAIVPNIPPPLRPARGLGTYHVLFEAEWERVAPRDPALLKHLDGDLWAVIAVWDLTELERAVLGQTRA